MTQRSKNIRQLILLGALIIITAIIALTRHDMDGFDYDKRLFTLHENTVITTVILKGKDFTNRFEYMNGAWEVNGKYLLDQGMRDIFFAILSRVEVKRPVAAMEKDSLVSYLMNEGVRLIVLNNADTIMKYVVGGNENRFQSYFMQTQDQQPYLVHIPGYQSYLAGIFYATENDWRSRYIWDFDWSSLKKLTIDLNDGSPPLIFEYKNDFLGVNGIAKLDTTKMMGYLENIAIMQTEKYLVPGEIPVYDKAIESNDANVIISVEQIGNKISSLRLYPKPDGKQYIPGVLNDGQRVLFNPKTLEKIPAQSADFERTE